MEISEVRIKLIPNPTDRFKAFASVTFDGDFVVRDIKIIDGASGVFVAMPSRKLADRCPKCSAKNHLRAKFCNECGASLSRDRSPRDKRGRTKLHADVAHPINSDCRHRLQERIVEAYSEEIEQSKKPGYKPLSDEEYEDMGEELGPELDQHESDQETPDKPAEAESEYESLIEDLKRDAAARRQARSRPPDRPSEPEPSREVQPEAEPVPVARDETAAAEPAPKEREEKTPQPQKDEEGDDFGAGLV